MEYSTKALIKFHIDSFIHDYYDYDDDDDDDDDYYYYMYYYSIIITAKPALDRHPQDFCCCPFNRGVP